MCLFECKQHTTATVHQGGLALTAVQQSDGLESMDCMYIVAKHSTVNTRIVVGVASPFPFHVNFLCLFSVTSCLVYLPYCIRVRYSLLLSVIMLSPIVCDISQDKLKNSIKWCHLWTEESKQSSDIYQLV